MSRRTSRPRKSDYLENNPGLANQNSFDYVKDKEAITWLTNSSKNGGRGRAHDMVKDNVLLAWQQTPHKDTLGFYGVGSPIHQPESVVFNQVLSECLAKASGGITRRHLSRKRGLPPQKIRTLGDIPKPQRCKTYVLNRRALQSEIQLMPHTRQQLDPRKALETIYCPHPIVVTHQLEKMIPGEALKTKRKPKPKGLRRRYWFCPMDCGEHRNDCTLYEWTKFKMDPRPYNKKFRESVEDQKEERRSEPKNYEQLYDKLIKCFEEKPSSDPLCKTYKICCEPPKKINQGGGDGKDRKGFREGPGGPGGPVGPSGDGNEVTGDDKTESEKETGKEEGDQGYGEEDDGTGDKMKKQDGEHEDEKEEKDKHTDTEKNKDKERQKQKETDKVKKRNINKDKDNYEDSETYRIGEDEEEGRGKKKKKNKYKLKKRDSYKDKDEEKRTDKKKKKDKYQVKKRKSSIDEGTGKRTSIKDKKDKNKVQRKQSYIDEDEEEKSGKKKKKDKNKVKKRKSSIEEGKGERSSEKEKEKKDKNKVAKRESYEDEDEDIGEESGKKKDKKTSKRKTSKDSSRNSDKDRASTIPNIPIEIDPHRSFTGEVNESDKDLPIKEIWKFIPKIPKKKPKKPKKKGKKNGKKEKDDKNEDKCRKEERICDPCPPPVCECEICDFLDRHCGQEEAPYMKEMRQEEKRRQLRAYYRQMCHREYIRNRICVEYRAPQHKCDPICCEDFFCKNPRLAEHCECLEAVQELQKLLCGFKDNQYYCELILRVEKLCESLCQRLCESILA
ncbi:DNA ligase 1 [Drosophila ficusphila]|uniref:DNA ligase 1 n=1 Tax=Drosophila ficusphila TaxID=30025 RepID=UPI001C89BCDF|nr:DNA ligase 1 [Drosophila ficusphila]